MGKIYTSLIKKLKKNWKKEYLLWCIIILWTSLVWEGHRIIPGAEWLSAVIPLWIVVLNIIFLFVIIALLANKKDFSPLGIIITIIGFSLSLILLRIGGERFPMNSVIGVIFIVLISIGLKIWKAKRN